MLSAAPQDFEIQDSAASTPSPNPASWLKYALLAVFASAALTVAPPALASEADAGATPATLQALKPLAAAIGESRRLEVSDAPKLPPVVAFSDRDDAAKALADFKGKIVLVNFWATFCAPCLKEMPSLQSLQRQLGGDDFQVVAINLDPTGKKRPLKWLQKNGIDALEFYHDRSWESARALGASGMPTTVLFDRSGKEVARLLGAAEWDGEAAIDAVKLLIRNAPDAG